MAGLKQELDYNTGLIHEDISAIVDAIKELGVDIKLPSEKPVRKIKPKKEPLPRKVKFEEEEEEEEEEEKEEPEKKPKKKPKPVEEEEEEEEDRCKKEL